MRSNNPYAQAQNRAQVQAQAEAQARAVGFNNYQHQHQQPSPYAPLDVGVSGGVSGVSSGVVDLPDVPGSGAVGSGHGRPGGHMSRAGPLSGPGVLDHTCSGAAATARVQPAPLSSVFPLHGAIPQLNTCNLDLNLNLQNLNELHDQPAAAPSLFDHNPSLNPNTNCSSPSNDRNLDLNLQHRPRQRQRQHFNPSIPHRIRRAAVSAKMEPNQALQEDLDAQETAARTWQPELTVRPQVPVHVPESCSLFSTSTASKRSAHARLKAQRLAALGSFDNGTTDKARIDMRASNSWAHPANPLCVAQGPRVGDKTPIDAITAEYAKADPVYVAKTMVSSRSRSRSRYPLLIALTPPLPFVCRWVSPDRCETTLTVI